MATGIRRNNNMILQKNPMLINTIVNDVLTVLPLQDMKQCRLVCHQWNSVAEPLLRRKGKIVFSHSFRPRDFLNYSKTNLPDLPFTAFKFCSYHITVENLYDFFRKWGNNIKSLDFQRLHVWTDDNDTNRNSRFDLNPLIDLVASSLVELKISSCNFNISLDKLSGIKSLTLKECEARVNTLGNRITPSKIYLRNVTFLDTGYKRLLTTVNDYVDFSKCSEIHIVGSFINEMNFDMSRDISSARKIDFDDMSLFFWKKANAKLDFLKLSRCSFADKGTNLRTKELEIKLSAVDLTVLPNNVEKLTLIENRILLNNCEPLKFPNLKYLNYMPQTKFIEPGLITQDVYKIISQFSNCLHLVDLELGGKPFDNTFCEVNLDWIPKTVKRLKLRRSMKFKFIVGDLNHLELDVLILEYSSCELAEAIMKKIKPKTLVANFIRVDKETTDDLISFVLRNQHLESIVVEIHEGLEKSSKQFEKTNLSKYVDHNSNYYLFRKNVGVSLTQKEFEQYSVIT